MYSLIVDSATKKLYVALLKDQEVIYEQYQVGRNDHSKYIVSLIEQALNKANIEVSNLNKLVVGVGPGSYTGVRMALTVLKMFASFKNIPLYKVSTLYLMSSNEIGLVSPQIDARRGNVFGAIYDMDKDEIIKEEALYPIEELNAKVISEDDFIVNPQKVLNKATLVLKPDLLVPNYLRDTEAERNLK